MLNTKRIKDKTVITVKYYDGEVAKFIYDANTKKLNGFSNDDCFKFFTMQDLINEFGRYTKGVFRCIDQYSIQEPQFKY